MRINILERDFNTTNVKKKVEHKQADCEENNTANKGFVQVGRK